MARNFMSQQNLTDYHDQLKEKLQAIQDKADQAATDALTAQDAADAAQDSADQASSAASTAQSTATTAKTTADNIAKDYLKSGDISSWAKASSKPSYSASEVGAIPTSAKGANGGVATLDTSGKIPSTQLPSYVDDVIEGYYYSSNFYSDSTHDSKINGEAGKIYVDLPTGKTYRWGSTAYAEISPSVTLGTNSDQAYPGNLGKAAAEAAAAAQSAASAAQTTADEAKSGLSSKLDTTTNYIGKLQINSNSATTVGSNGTLVLKQGSNVTLSKSGNEITISATDTNTDTHHIGYIRATTSTGTSNVTSNTSDPYINYVENGSLRSGVQLKGSGATSISANGGVITITSSNTNPSNYFGYVKTSSESSSGSAGSGGTLTFAGSGATSVSRSGNTITISSSDSNTHYTSYLKAGGSTGTSNTTTSSNPYLILVEDSTRRSGIQLKGSGATSISCDNTGVVTINSTNTTYSSLPNPNALTLTMNGTKSTYTGASTASKTWYAPTSSGTSGQILKSSGSNSAPTWVTADLLTLSTDLSYESVS